MIYSLLAPIYDELNKEIDYSAWADFIEEIIRREYSKGTPELVLDLGCGTGRMTLELGRRGYDMTGVDSSAEMLEVARERASEEHLDSKMLWLMQDMREFELYGTVDVVVSCLDCINHLSSASDVKKCFSLVHNYLIPDGLFIFDINGKYKFENVYADRSYVMECGADMCVWENYYNPKSRLCDFYITLFKEDSDGKYLRYDEAEREKMYPLASVKRMLSECNLEFLGAYSDYSFTPGGDENERIYVVAKCKK